METFIIMKKFLIAVGLIVLLIFLLAIIAPFVVDLNKYRGTVKEIVEEKINGTFDVQSIELTILSGFGADVSGVVLKNSDKFNKATLFKVDRLKLRAPIFAIFTGVSTIDLIVDSPNLTVLKNKKGELNVVDIIKKVVTIEETPEVEKPEGKVDAPPAPKVTAPKEKKAEAKPQKETEEKKESSPLNEQVLSMIKRIKINVIVSSAAILYEDQALEKKTSIEDVNISFLDINLGEKFKFNIESSLKLDDPQMTLEGDIEGTGDITANLVDGKPEVELESEFDLTKLALQIPGTVIKEDSDDLKVKFYFRLNDYKLKITNEVNLKLSELMGREFNDKISLKTRLNSNLGLDFVPQYSDLSVRFNSKGSDFKFRVKLSMQENLEFDIRSKYLNIDDFVPPPPAILPALLSSNEKKEDAEGEDTEGEDKKAEEAKTDEKAKGVEEKKAEEEAPKEIFDPFKEVREDPFLIALKVDGNFQLNRVIAARTEVTNIIGTMTLNRLKLFANSTLNIYRGNINLGQLVFNMRTRRPLFVLDATMLNVDLEPAFKSLVGVEDAAKGKFKGKLDFKGAGIDPETIKKTLKGEAEFSGADVKLKTFNVLQGAKNTLKKNALLEKINLSSYKFDEGIDKLQLELVVRNEKADVKIFEVYREKQYLLNMKGYSTLDMICDLNGSLRIIRPLSTKIAVGRSAKKLFLNRNKEVVLPFYVRGPVANPEYGVDGDKANALYGKKVKDKAVSKLKSAAKKAKVKEKVIDKVPEALDSPLKIIFNSPTIPPKSSKSKLNVYSLPLSSFLA